jgi:LytS/YehU family sensor histidine kinase
VRGVPNANLSCDQDHLWAVTGMWCPMALSDSLARHRAVVWLAAVFLGPVVAALLTLARPSNEVAIGAAQAESDCDS